MKDATLKELRRYAQPVATPSELRRISEGFLNPGFQSKPWAGIGERFQRNGVLHLDSVSSQVPIHERNARNITSG